MAYTFNPFINNFDNIGGIGSTPGLAQALRGGAFAGYSVIGHNPNNLHGLRTTGSNPLTSRKEYVTKYALSCIRVVYSNYCEGSSVISNNYGEFPNTNQISVNGILEYVNPAGINTRGLSGFPITFSGQRVTWINGTSYVISDPIYCNIPAGSRFFIATAAGCSQLPVPSAPTAVAVTSGTGNQTVGTYQVSITFIYPSGYETPGSICTAVTTVNATDSISVTSPSDPGNGAIGYRVYVGGVGAPNTSPQYISSGVVSFGTNYSIIRIPSPTNTSVVALPQVSGGSLVGIPTGIGVAGGTAAGSSNNGEGYRNNLDYSENTWNVAGIAAGNIYSPSCVLGVTTTGAIAPSVTISGDSIASATADNGYMWQAGGFILRALNNQISALAYDPAIVPLFGSTWIAQGSESASIFKLPYNSQQRTKLAALTTHVICNYGTNDLVNGSARVSCDLATVSQIFTGQGQKYFHCTMCPKTTSTDGWQTIANQTVNGSNDYEAYRRAINNVIILDKGAALSVVNEAMWRSAASLYTSTSNPYSGGDGTTNTFITAYPFKQGTEVIKVNGATKTVITDYTYLTPFTSTQDGFAYASGVTFTSGAPGNGLSVTASYTSIPGLGAQNGSTLYQGYFDTGGKVEVNATNVPGINGGWWGNPVAAATITGTTTATSSSSLTDSTKTWTQDQYRGWSMMITADATTPAAVGQVRCLQYNTSNLLSSNSSWTTTPSVGASYLIFKPLAQDGTHPTSVGHLLMAAGIDTSRIN